MKGWKTDWVKFFTFLGVSACCPWSRWILNYSSPPSWGGYGASSSGPHGPCGMYPLVWKPELESQRQREQLAMGQTCLRVSEQKSALEEHSSAYPGVSRTVEMSDVPMWICWLKDKTKPNAGGNVNAPSNRVCSLSQRGTWGFLDEVICLAWAGGSAARSRTLSNQPFSS